jgi:hypothetical protein
MIVMKLDNDFIQASHEIILIGSRKVALRKSPQFLT